MNRKLVHGNNPILNWHASCLALVTDGGDNCKPAKPPRDTAAKRIDGIAVTITAMARALFAKTIRSVIRACEVWANLGRTGREIDERRNTKPTDEKSRRNRSGDPPI
jgi:hypothetical protein